MTDWEKLVGELGLLLMRPNVRRDRLNGLMEGNTIHADKVAALLDECKVSLLDFAEKHEETETIKAMLEKIDGKTVVAMSTGDDLAEWVMGIQEAISDLTI